MSLVSDNVGLWLAINMEDASETLSNLLPRFSLDSDYGASSAVRDVSLSIVDMSKLNSIGFQSPVKVPLRFSTRGSFAGACTRPFSMVFRGLAEKF